MLKISMKDEDAVFASKRPPSPKTLDLAERTDQAYQRHARISSFKEFNQRLSDSSVANNSAQNIGVQVNTTLISPTSAQPKRVFFCDSSTQTTVTESFTDISDRTHVSISKTNDSEMKLDEFPMPPVEIQRENEPDNKKRIEEELRSVSRSSSSSEENSSEASTRSSESYKTAEKEEERGDELIQNRDEDIAVELNEYKSVQSDGNPSHLDKTDINYPQPNETKEEILQNKSQPQSIKTALPKKENLYFHRRDSFPRGFSIKDRLKKWQDLEQNSQGIQTEDQAPQTREEELAPPVSNNSSSSNVQPALETTEASEKEPSAEQNQIEEASEEQNPATEDNEEEMRLQREKGSVLKRWPENEPADDGNASVAKIISKFQTGKGWRAQQKNSTDYTKRMVEIKDQENSVSKITSSWESKNAGYLDDSSWMDRAKSLSESHHYEPEELLQNETQNEAQSYASSSSSSSSSDSEHEDIQEAESIYQEERVESPELSQRAESFVVESPSPEVDESSTTSVHQLRSFFENCF
ncbi:Oidioi.mRNA.OKI2018_I69.PAR.g11048.t2.cds [Oikopleura dioica]|uniref:Oidioi.mRNA.OKI2018_I69.PAR.g11048.t2.cds n=1 Tax=Oikopleura dioica TaxID=34765 RepID=A0ABN7RTQ4_OIKDI|nr:Oidioi.mRNA.OKI2018_I69.PAR.g11048.t2.cds [Oikopleura dioica]